MTVLELARTPAGWFSRVRWIAKVDVGRRSSSTRIGDITTPSMAIDVSLGIAMRGLPTRLDAIIAPPSSNSVISRNSRNCRT